MTNDSKRGEMELFLQGEGIDGIVLVRVPADGTVRELVREAGAHGFSHPDVEVFVFVQDSDDSLSLEISLEDAGLKHRGHVHVHRCRQVGVVVNFNGAEKRRDFAPSATVARVKRWAVGEHGFDLSDMDAAEHVLQVCGTTHQLDDDEHIGGLVHVPSCELCLDLVPKIRVEG